MVSDANYVADKKVIYFFYRDCDWLLNVNCHCVKKVRIWSCSSPYFPAFGLNTKTHLVSLCIQSECGKIWTRITPVYGHFFRSVYCEYWRKFLSQMLLKISVRCAIFGVVFRTSKTIANQKMFLSASLGDW